MFEDLLNIVRANPQIFLFLSLAIGYFVGNRLKIFGFTLGTTVSVLLAALILGQVGIKIPPALQSISFSLFIFTVGYKVGPQFFDSFKKEGFNYLCIASVTALTAIATAIVVGKFIHFDKGTITGMFAGAVTTSSALGTGSGAIKQLAISAEHKKILNSNMTIAYAVTYVFGCVGTIIALKLIPKFLGIDLKQEARNLKIQMAGGIDSFSDGTGLFSWNNRINARTYEVNKQKIIGRKISHIEGLFKSSNVAIDRIKRGEKIINGTSNVIVQKHDILLVLGKTTDLINASNIIGKEMEPISVLDVTGSIKNVAILSDKIIGKSLEELSKKKFALGIFLDKIIRQGHKIPISKDTVIQKCDVLRLIGSQDDVDNAIKFLGYAEKTTITDLAVFSLGCVLGTLIGLIVIKVFGVPITLGVGGGVLVAGLLCGWLRSKHPTFGQIPVGAQWMLSNLGLNLFVACIGLSAGAQAVHALKTTGVEVFFGGAVITIIPIIVASFLGHKVLKMNPIFLLGAITGAHNTSAALNVLIEDADSSLPVLGYAAPYALANFWLTICGGILITIM
jgi:putative transport protein